MKRLLLLLFIMLIGCQLDSGKTIDREKFTFKIGTDTQLFFKNMRQSYYDFEANEAAGLKTYRFAKRLKSDSLPLLNLAIVINYLDDEAYLLLEANEVVGELPIHIISTDTAQVSKILMLEEMNRESMLNFIADIYEGILAKNQYQIKIDSTAQPILVSHEEREAFRITVSDYFRLTRVY